MGSSGHIKSTFKHALIYSSAGIIGKAVGFIMLPIYSHHLQTEGYGVIGMIDTVLSVLTLLIGYGISGAMSRFYYETNDDVYRKKIVSTTILMMFALVIVVTSPVLLFSKPVSWLAFGRSDWNYYIILAVLSFIATMTAKNAENYIYILQRSFFVSFISIIRLVISLSLNIYFIVYLEMGVLGYLYSSLIDGVLYSLFMHYIALRSVGLSFDREIAYKVFNFSLPLLPGYIAMFVRANTNRILLRTFMGLSQVGVFEVLFKFSTLIGFFIVEPFSKIWNVKSYEICDQEDGPQILADMFTYYLAILLFAGLILSLEIPKLIKILTPESFWISGSIVYFAVVSRIFNASYYHLFFGLMYAKKTFKISQIRIYSTIIGLIITVPMVWGYGLWGAVFASFISAAIQCVMAYFMARPFYVIPFHWRKNIQMFILMTVLFIVASDFSLSGTSVGENIQSSITPYVENSLKVLYLDRIKDGTLVRYAVQNSILILDGIILFIYSLFFILGINILGIVKIREIILEIKTIFSK